MGWGILPKINQIIKIEFEIYFKINKDLIKIFKLSHSICDCDLKMSSLQVIRDNYEEVFIKSRKIIFKIILKRFIFQLVKSSDLQSLTKEALIEIMKIIIPVSTLDPNDVLNA